MHLLINESNYVITHVDEMATWAEEMEFLEALQGDGEQIAFAYFEINLAKEASEVQAFLQERTLFLEDGSSWRWVAPQTREEMERILRLSSLYDCCVVRKGSSSPDDAVFRVKRYETIDSFNFLIQESVPGEFQRRVLSRLENFPKIGIPARWEARWQPQEHRVQVEPVTDPAWYVGRNMEPLSGGGWVWYDGEDIRVYDEQKRLLCEFSTEDDIYDVQVGAGDLWVLFDEDSADGVVCYGEDGTQKFALALDCQAVHAVGPGEAWLYLLPNFELVHVKDGVIIERAVGSPAVGVDAKTAYALAFVVHERHMLFATESSELYWLSPSGEVRRLLAGVTFGSAYSRGSKLLLRSSTGMYELDIKKGTPII